MTAKKILFITYNTIKTGSCRERAYYPAKAIQQHHLEVRVKLIYLTTYRDIDWADIVIFQRIPQAAWYFNRLHIPQEIMLWRIQELFHYSRSQKHTGIDMDDYVFLEGSELKTGVPDHFLPKLLKDSHFAIASTEALKLELEKYTPKVAVIQNALDFEVFEDPDPWDNTVKVLKLIKSWKERGFFVLGWTAGKTHERDFRIFHEVVEHFDDTLLQRVKILLIGSKNQKTSALPDFVHQTDFMPWHQLWVVLRDLDLNMVILEDNLLNQCKSELKLIEAGYFGVPSICSPVGIFGDLVYKNEIGLLAANPKEWVEQIKHLIRQSDLRKKLGGSARKFVLENYDLKDRGTDYLELFSQLGQFR